MEKIWLQSYPAGIPVDINPDRFQSLIDIIEQSSTRFADLPAFYNLGVTLTYRQIDNYSRAFAAYLQQELQLEKGDRLAIMLPNVLQYPIALFGALRAGLVVVNVNPMYTPAELIHQLKDAGAKTIVVLANFAHTVQKAQQELSLKHVIVCEIGDFFSLPKAFLVNWLLKYIHKKIPAWHIPAAIKFKQVLAKGRHLSLQPVHITSEDIAFLQYTGGTTGIAKGAMLTHRNLIANILQAEAWLSLLFNYGEEIIITALPLYHIFSLLANCLFIYHVGGFNVLITDPRNVDAGK